MAVIALAGLVVVPEHNCSGLDQRHPVFVRMGAAENPPWHPPDDDLLKGAAPQFHSLAEEGNRSHVALSSNTSSVVNASNTRILPNLGHLIN